MKNKLSVPALLLLFLLIFSLPAFASEKDHSEVEKAKEVLESTLQYLVDGQIYEYAENVINDRFETYDEALSNYQEIVDYDPVLDFNILRVIEESEEKVSFLVEVELETAILEEPYHMVKEEGIWKLYLRAEPIETWEYTVTKIKNEEYLKYLEQHGIDVDVLLQSGIDSGVLEQPSIDSGDFTINHWRRDFSGTISNSISTANFDMPGGIMGINVTKHKMSGAWFPSFYEAYYVIRDTSNRNLHTPITVKGTGDRSAVLSRFPVRGHLNISTDIGGNGSYSFEGYLYY